MTQPNAKVDEKCATSVTAVEVPGGPNFKVAITPVKSVDEILNVTLDPDNEVFDVREINIGDEDFVITMGRSWR